ncbi:hypothetical protein ACHHYP_02372 [Achlya hypogyna]|uniref:Uncharacterized protein n=1 Tax=Achlya hypogyna TaxID=1202772 RepID=A0A1V9Z6Y5_ACHHY|nr:hypothetical protein ACHHYP_02372 [Achlya hypogyna]
MLKLWDEATKQQRKGLLEAFVVKYTAPGALDSTVDLERDFGTTSTLYLSRVLSWLRLSCADGFALTQHLQAVRVFLHANHELLQDFIDMDGVRILLYVLAFPSHVTLDADCIAVIQLFQHIGRSGRTYKEYMSSCGIEMSVISCCIAKGHATCETPLWLACRSLLIEQSTGNPRSTSTTYAVLAHLIDQKIDSVKCMGSQILRELISKKSPYFDARFCKLQVDNSIAVAMALLHHQNYRVQYEALELIHIVLENPSLHAPLCTAMLNWFRECAVVKEHNVPRSAEELVEVECFVHLKSPVMRLCRCLDSIIFECPSIADLAIQLGAVDILIYVILVSNEGSLKWHAAWFTLLLMTARAVVEDPYCAIGSSCVRTSEFVREALAAKATDIMSPADEHEFSDCMDLLMGDSAHRKKIWRHLYRLGWPIRRNDDDAEPGSLDAELRALEVQVEEAIADVAQDPVFEDDLLDDGDSTHVPRHDDHFYVQKLHEHFRHYRLTS